MKTVITIGYVGARNRGVEQAIAWLKAKYPNAEIKAIAITPATPPAPKLDWFHAKLGKVV